MVRGRNDDTLFSRPQYTTIGDAYQDLDKLKRHDYRVGQTSSPPGHLNWHRPSAAPGLFSRFAYSLREDSKPKGAGAAGGFDVGAGEGNDDQDFAAPPGANRSGRNDEKRNDENLAPNCGTGNGTGGRKVPYCSTTKRVPRGFGGTEAFSGNSEPADLRLKVN